MSAHLPLIVADERPRVCPACQAPMELVGQGDDARGPFEVWSCTNRSEAGELVDVSGHVSAGAPKTGRITLRTADYERAAARRSRITRLRPDPTHAPTCNRGAGLPGRCTCRGYPYLKRISERASKGA